MRLGAFVVTCGRLSLLARTVETTLAALPQTANLFILVNGGHAPTEEWLSLQADPRLGWSVVAKEPRTKARNRAFLLGWDVIQFFDDDVEIPLNFFEKLSSEISGQPRIAIWGGPNLTPPSSLFFEWLSGECLSSRWVVFGAAIRYRAKVSRIPASPDDFCLCNLAVRTAEVPDSLRFRHLASNEENVFLREASLAGLQLGFSQGLCVYHHRRPTLLSFARQIFSYGEGRGQQFRLQPLASLVFLALPAFFLIMVIAGMALHWSPCAVLLGSYAVLALATVTEKKCSGMGLRVAMLLPILGLIPIIHAGYALGLLKGLFPIKLASRSDLEIEMKYHPSEVGEFVP